jgi:very-short-patch-repair endonuclease
MDITEHMAKLLKKCQNKKWELYVISRLWYELKDERVVFTNQQVIYAADGKRYYADLYLPQLNLVIEIDEEYHKKQEVKDKNRELYIHYAIGATVKHIDCGDKSSSQSVDEQIEKMAKFIKERIAMLERLDSFKVRDFDEELSADFHINKEYLSVLDNDAVSNTTEAFKLFHLKSLQCSCQKIPYLENLAVWCPIEQGKEWRNKLEQCGTILTEQYVGEKEGVKESLPPDNPKEKRIVFLKGKDSYGRDAARFAGVFKYRTTTSGKSEWYRVSYFCDLRNLFQYSNI